jgi:hypothetical protein
MLDCKVSEEDFAKQERQALDLLRKVEDPSITEFMETFAIRNDPTELLTDLLL